MFKTVFALSALIISSCGVAAPAAQSFMPDNDLWIPVDAKEVSSVTQDLFNKIIDAGTKAYSQEARDNRETIQIQKLWSSGTVNADVRRSGNSVIIRMYGGLARAKEITPSGFSLVLCHELGGHAYGGAPYIYPQGKLSAEGQADYMSTKECYRRIYALVPEMQEENEQYEEYISNNCANEDVACKNGLVGAKGLGQLLSSLMQEENLPTFETPDPYVAPETMLSYPKTAQCRLDSYVAGMFQQVRPVCWFKN